MDTGLAIGVDAGTCCQAASDKDVIVVRDDIDVGSGTGEVNACLEGTVMVTDDGGSAGYVSTRQRVLERSTYLGMNGLAVVNSIVGEM